MQTTIGAIMRKVLFVPLVMALMAAVPKPAEAVAIVGTLDIAGAVRIVDLGGGQTLIDWLNPVGVEATSTGTFAGIGGTDTMIDLSSILFPTSGFAPLSQFQTLSARPTFDFTLTDILACSELGPFVTCSAGAASAFGFAQIGSGVTVTAELRGTVQDSVAPNPISTWTGTFTAQFPNTTIAALLAGFAQTGSIDTSFSASKITVLQVPEPMTLALFGVALFGGALRARRRR